MKENEFAESVLHKVPYPLTAQELINGLTKLEIYDIALEFVNSKPFTTRADKHLYIMDFYYPYGRKHGCRKVAKLIKVVS